MEKTFIMVKPDGVQRGLIGEIIQRFEKKGFTLVAGKLMQIPTELAEKHYIEHKERPFFGDLISFITSGPVFAMVWEGAGVVKTARKMIGETNPAESTPGSIRADYAVVTNLNVIHGSDSLDSAAREISLFFDQDELMDYQNPLHKWIYEA